MTGREGVCKGPTVEKDASGQMERTVSHMHSDVGRAKTGNLNLIF